MRSALRCVSAVAAAPPRRPPRFPESETVGLDRTGIGSAASFQSPTRRFARHADPAKSIPTGHAMHADETPCGPMGVHAGARWPPCPWLWSLISHHARYHLEKGWEKDRLRIVSPELRIAWEASTAERLPAPAWTSVSVDGLAPGIVGFPSCQRGGRRSLDGILLLRGAAFMVPSESSG